MSWRHLSEIELTEYADSEMSPTSMDRVEEHLRQCDSCAAALAASRRVLAALGRLNLEPAPAGLRSRVREKLAPEIEKALTCRQAFTLLHQCIDHSISPIAAARLERHVESCPGCRQDAAALEAATHLVRSLTPVESPAAVREKVAAASRGRARRASWEFRLRPVLASAGIVAIGVLAVLLRPALQIQREQPAPVIAMRSAAPISPIAPPAARPTVAPPPISVAEAEADAAGPEAEPSEVAPFATVGHEPVVRQVRHVAVRVSRAPKALPAVVQQRLPRPTITLAAAPAAPVPAAVQALKAVAGSAEFDRDAQRAMDEAAESFATLRSEEILDSMPEPALLTTTDKTGQRPDTASPAPTPAGSKEPGRDSASVPEGTEAVPPGPLV